MPVDDSSMQAAFHRLRIYATEGWKMVAAEEARKTIVDLTDKGLDADGQPFPLWSEYHPDEEQGHTYSPRQEEVRKRQGLETEFKNLNQGRLGLLRGLRPRAYGGKIVLAVADTAQAKLNRIAQGQMEHPKWLYHHKFLANGRIMMARVMAVVIAPLLRSNTQGITK